jgi:hypothetical protein
MDLFIITLSLLGGLLIFRKDATHLFLNLVQVVLSLCISIYEYQSIADSMLKGGMVTQTVAEIIAFLVIWLGVFLLCAVFIFLQRHIVEIKFKPWIEKPVGMLLGMLQTGMLGFSLLFFILILPIPSMIESVSNQSICTQALLENLPKITEKIIPMLNLEKKFDSGRFLKQISITGRFDSAERTSSNEIPQSDPQEKEAPTNTTNVQP